MQANSLSFTIVPEIPVNYFSKFYEYMNKFFLVPQKDRFADISTGEFSVSYSVLDSSGKKILSVRASGSQKIDVVIEPLSEPVPEAEVLKSKEDLEISR